MSSAPDARPFPWPLAAFARLVARLFFRHLEVVGRERVPRSGPILVVANHQNSLVDPMLVVGFLGRRPRFLAKSTLWAHPVVGPLLRLARGIPVARRQDPGFDADRNEETFDAARAVLAGGGGIALFPEGRSHSEPRLVAIRTGAARIVTGLDDATWQALAIVPVGLHFDDKTRFRSGALVRVGEPLRAADLPAAVRTDARALTAVIADALEAVTLSYPSVEVAQRVERAIELVLVDPEAPLAQRRPRQRRPRLRDAVALRKTVTNAYEHLASTHGETLAEIERELDGWQRVLDALGLRDDELARAPLPGRRRQLAGLILGAVATAPAAALGIVLHWPAYQVCSQIARRVGSEPDLPATYKLFGGMFLFPATWLVVAVATAVATASWSLAGAAALVSALAAVAALRWLDRRATIAGMVRSWIVLAPRHRRERLLARRRALRDKILGLAELAGLPAAAGAR